MAIERDIRPYELQPVGILPDTASVLVDDPDWDEARRLPKTLLRQNAVGDDLLLGLLSSDEPAAATGKLYLYFDGTALKAKLPDGSVALLTQLGVGLYQPHDATLDAFAQAASGADLLPYFAGVDQVAATPLTPFSRGLMAAVGAVEWRSGLGLGSTATMSVPALPGAQASPDEVVRGDDPRLGATSDPTLSALSALTVSTADLIPYSTGVETFGLAAFTAAARTFVAAANAAAQRTALGLGNAVTLNVPSSGGAQAATNELVRGDDPRLVASGSDATLTGLAALTVGAANLMIYSTGAEAFATVTTTAYGRTALGYADASAERTALGLGTAAQVNTGTGATNAILGNDARLSDVRGSTWGAIGGTLASQTDLNTALGGKQPSNSNLTAFAGLTGATDGLPYFTAVATLALTTLTAFGRTLAALADAAAGRTALGLAGAALLNVGTTTGTVAAGDDSRFTNTRALTAGTTVPQHKFTRQATKNAAYTLASADGGTQIVLNHAGPHVVPGLATLGSGFAVELVAQIGCTVSGAATGTTTLTAGQKLIVQDDGGAIKYYKLTPDGTFT